MMLEKAVIRENIEFGAPSCYRMILETPKNFQAQAGQFLQIQVDRDSTDPILRRPFSIADISQNRLTVVYQVKGKGTLLLSRLQKNERVSFLGPLGNPYPIVAGPKIILAGGLGAAGLLFLAKKLSDTSEDEKPLVILGSKNKTALFLRHDFQELGLPVRCATEDGSCEFKGLATSLLNQTIKRQPRKGVLYACGPNPMLAEAGRIAEKYGWPAYFSLETMMACGIGICRGCAVLTGQGYRLACVDGPVFPAKEIIWDENVQPKQIKNRICRT